MDGTEGIQVEIQEKGRGKDFFSHPPRPHLGINNLYPQQQHRQTHMRQGKNKHIFLHTATFIQGPIPLLDDPWQKVDVLPVLPP